MTLILIPLLLALVAVLAVPRIKARQAAAGERPGRSPKRSKQPPVRKFVL